MMRKLLLLLTAALFIVACKNETKSTITEVDEITKEDITTSVYPEAITKVFDAHGGIDQWNKMQTLYFTIDKPNGKEETKTNLKTRAELIETPTYNLGFDGKTYWIDEKGDNKYEGNAKFYKGLMMYFYAMPFIVSDDGIIYGEAEPLTFEGQTYPGILISYESEIGVSPNDQYILYYDADSGQMQWLAYTVTFGEDEQSEKFKYIRYNDWQTINNLVMPKSISWYNIEDNQPTELSNTVDFINVVISEDEPDNTMFSVPEGAKIVE